MPDAAGHLVRGRVICEPIHGALGLFFVSGNHGDGDSRFSVFPKHIHNGLTESCQKK